MPMTGHNLGNGTAATLYLIFVSLLCIFLTLVVRQTFLSEFIFQAAAGLCSCVCFCAWFATTYTPTSVSQSGAARTFIMEVGFGSIGCPRPVPVTCARYIQQQSVQCTLSRQTVRWCWHCIALHACTGHGPG